MSSLPQSHQHLMGKPNQSNMAVATQPKVKATVSKANNATSAKGKMQMHRRSRTGCYTCRLRRKKCDEGSPCCSACKNLGLKCDYKRPVWWSNNDHRRVQKDNIKLIIKQKKVNEKSTTNNNSNNAQQVLTPGSDTPPELSHSLPTSATFSNSLDRTRSASVDSSFSLDFEFNAPQIADFTAYNAQMHSSHSNYAPIYPEYGPYEVDVKTERQMFIDGDLTRTDSTISTFNTFQPPDAMLPSFPAEGEWFDESYLERRESMPEEALNMNFFEFSNSTPVNASSDDNSIETAFECKGTDGRLYTHFLEAVLPTCFPILETNQHGSVRSDMIYPALKNNACYLHCCLSVAAQHYKHAMGLQGQEIDDDILRHRFATISTLCEALPKDENHTQILEATLGMIFYQSVVGSPSDNLPDIPWHQHFQAAHSLVQKLQLPELVLDIRRQHQPTPFNMTLTAWIDILGATILGHAPTFAHAYREKHLSQHNTSLGLRELMGCEDRVMYLISEIACLDDLKRNGMEDVQLCNHVTSLGGQIGLTEPTSQDRESKIPFNAQGVLSPKQLSKNVTAAFRLAARIYLCSLVPGFHPSQDSCIGLVEKLSRALEFIPAGPGGFDRSMVWVYLIGGSVGMAGSSFRTLFEERVVGLESLSETGSFGKLQVLLREVWSVMDDSAAKTPGGGMAPYVSWRDVMQMKGWDFLLI